MRQDMLIENGLLMKRQRSKKVFLSTGLSFGRSKRLSELDQCPRLSGTMGNGRSKFDQL